MQPYKIDGQILVMMLGVPGSGKSAFARQLAETLGWKRCSTDAIKTELYGRPDPGLQPNVSEAEKKEIKLQTFRLLEQRVEEALLTGHSVIRDHMHHRRDWREIGRRQAAAVGALPVAVWIRTPHDLAHERGMTRKLKQDQRVETDPKKMRQAIDFYHDTLEQPSSEENCLEIDGRINFSQQLEQFTRFCQQRLAKRNRTAMIPAQSLSKANSFKDRQMVVLMSGVPGAGKSSFARRLETEFGWRRLNRVALRQELFGSTAYPKSQRDRAYLEEILDIRLRETIHSGQSVILDYKHNCKYERDYVYGLAADAGALQILVHLQTPKDTAIERGMNRPDARDSVKASYSHIRSIIENNLALWEKPSATEPLLTLDGLSSIEEQLANFRRFCRQELQRQDILN